VSVRRQLSWINTGLPSTSNKYAGWDGSGNPAVKDLTTAIANELAKSNGSDGLVPSTIFALPSNGNLQLGSASLGGNRTIATVSASTSSTLSLVCQGPAASIIMEAANILVLKSGTNVTLNVYNSAGSEAVSIQGVQMTGPLSGYVIRGGVNLTGNGGALVIQGGGSQNDTGGLLTIQGASSTSGNGGNVVIEAGIGGAGDGDVTIDTFNGNLILNIATSPAGLPSGAAYWNANVLTRVP
jgi:hypothetical protein